MMLRSRETVHVKRFNVTASIKKNLKVHILIPGMVFFTISQ